MRRSALLAAIPPAILGAAIALAGPAAAHADPCKAIPDDGPAPSHLQPGSTFSGRVVHVIDGDSLCVALGPDQGSWVEVRLADFYADELDGRGGEQAKAALQRIAFGKQATCTAEGRSYDRVVSSCRIGGQAIGELMRRSAVTQGGRGYEPVAEAPAPIASASAWRPANVRAVSRSAFRSCAAARAAGAAPLYRGEPGYGPHLDRDNDGVACEPYRGR